MNKNTCKSIQLGKGEMHIYDFGGVRLYAYQTHALIDDEAFLLEKDGKVLVLESPCFFDNIAELTAYLEERGWSRREILVSYHAAGASFHARGAQIRHARRCGVLRGRRRKGPDRRLRRRLWSGLRPCRPSAGPLPGGGAGDHRRHRTGHPSYRRSL